MHIFSLVLEVALLTRASATFFPRPFFSPANTPQTIICSLDKDSFEAWLGEQTEIATDRLLANIAPEGRNARDAAPGSIIASPSKEHPNYYFQWVRDAAITASSLVTMYSADPYAPSSRRLLNSLFAYASLQRQIQHTANPSGSFDDLTGLGEPKFMVSGGAFTGSWGRPQRDGPALRALALIAFLRAYNATHPSNWASEDGMAWFNNLHMPGLSVTQPEFGVKVVESVIGPAVRYVRRFSTEYGFWKWNGFLKPALPANSTIKADLEYVARYWRDPGFDLWEEVEGLHLFTMMMQRRALSEGTQLALAFGDAEAATFYQGQHGEMTDFMRKRFWDESKGHLVETLGSSRSGLDCALLLGSIHTTSTNSTDDSMYPPHSDEMLVSLLALVRDMRHRFPINAVPVHPKAPNSSVYNPLVGVGIGRYPEDVYDGDGMSGGNPWFLCTCTVAEVLYRVSHFLVDTGSLDVTTRGYPFWEALLAPTPSGSRLKADKRYPDRGPVFKDAVAQLRAVGDAFLDVIRIHKDADGALSEQFDRSTGYERGAKDLTWSYGAFLQAVWAREMAA